MQRSNRWTVMILMAAALLLSACARPSAATTKANPVQIEEVAGSAFKRVVLTEKAAERLDIQTAAVREEPVNGAQRLVVPYAAVIYGLQGETWVYTNGEPLVFVRQPISVDYIEGDLVVMSDGPVAGTAVVTVGGALLYGAETGVSK